MRRRLDLGANVSLPPTVQAPEPLLGATAKHALAKLAQQHNVITVIGTGGMGKTALATFYARRFRAALPRRRARYSFTAGEVDDGDFPARSASNDGWRCPGRPKRRAAAQTILDELRRREAAAAGRQFRERATGGRQADHPQHAAARQFTTCWPRSPTTADAC